MKCTNFTKHEIQSGKKTWFCDFCQISPEEQEEDDEEYSEGKSGSDPEDQQIQSPSVSKKKSVNKRKISDEDLMKKLDSVSSQNEKLLKKVEWRGTIRYSK
ncbi:hypothetical protein HHI36_006531 [Cryptolaemus montrouzieri]|uniref:Uncharacterized protein n=1 Tax=Cryptolaemus montrouzieri TaxID=559131 RepID=A0ABD2NXE6_9CUCU